MPETSDTEGRHMVCGVELEQVSTVAMTVLRLCLARIAVPAGASAALAFADMLRSLGLSLEASR